MCTCSPCCGATLVSDAATVKAVAAVVDVVYTDRHRLHDPPHQFARDRMIPYSERPQRAAAIRDALVASGGFRFRDPHPLNPADLERVHDGQYLRFLRDVYPCWIDAGRPPAGVIPDTFAVRPLDVRPDDLLAQAGYYCFDAQTPIVAATFDAALASAGCALTAAHEIRQGATAVYALCRPPGHHASRDMYGGYCYLNNAALAAELLCRDGRTRVAIVDVDYHHGNGTQEIFYSSDRVVTVSLHADPGRAYPFFSGYPEERGEVYGANLNIAMAPAVGDDEFVSALRRALDFVDGFSPGHTVVSLGVDTLASDPLGDFELSLDGFTRIGRTLAARTGSALFIQEGGYDVAAMGQAVSLLLGAYEAGP